MINWCRNGTGCTPCGPGMTFSATQGCICSSSSNILTDLGCFQTAINPSVTSSQYSKQLKYVRYMLYSSFRVVVLSVTIFLVRKLLIFVRIQRHLLQLHNVSFLIPTLSLLILMQIQVALFSHPARDQI